MNGAPGGDPGTISQADQLAWTALKALLERDAEGRQILQALSTDPAAGAAILQARLDRTEAPGALQTYVSGGNVGKLAAIARAEQVTLVENTYRGEQDAGLELLRQSSGCARALIVGGLVICVLGFATFMVSIFVAGNSSDPSAGPPVTLPLGFGVFFLGGVIAAAGQLMVAMRKRQGA